MPELTRRRKKILLTTLGVCLLGFVVIAVAARFFVEPILRKKIRSLVIAGSDSLYTYHLGKLNASFLTGNVEIEDLQINIDSNRYRYLLQRDELPSFTMEVSLSKAHLKGIGVIDLLLRKKIAIEEMASNAVNIRYMRHPRDSTAKSKPPLWKLMRPDLKSIAIRHIRLDSIKFLYKTKDTATFTKLQFDRFDAKLDHFLIDSAATADTGRLAFSKDIFLRWHDLKYRTADSSYKLKAEWITYSSKNKMIEVDSFKLQPTLQKEDYYKTTGLSNSLYYIEFDKIRMTNVDLARLFHNDALIADSFLVDKPRLSIYLDKTQERVFMVRTGSFPHQRLRNAATTINIKHIILTGAKIEYTEKNLLTRQEGKLLLHPVNMHIQNATNDHFVVKANPLCTVSADAKILGGSPLQMGMTFYLDSANASFNVKGNIKNVTAAQLNQLSVPLANIYLPSLQLHELDFFIKGDEWTTWTDVHMRYSNLALVMRSINEQGVNETKGFLTKLLNRYVIHTSNPGPEGIERSAKNVRFMRLMTQAFFGVIWKSLFGGMQGVMLKSGKINT